MANKIKRQAVKSSNILEVGYDKVEKILEVEFHLHRVYQYWPVPQDEYDNLMNADSIGSYLNKNIAHNPKYNTKKI